MRTAEIELRRSLGVALDEAEGLTLAAVEAKRNMTEDELSRFDTLNKQVDEWSKALGDLGAVDAARAALPDPGRLAPVEPTRTDSVDRFDEFARSEEISDFLRRGGKGTSAGFALDGMSIRSLIDNTTSTSGAAFTQPALRPQVPLAVPDRALKLIDLLPHGSTSDSAVVYVQDTTTTGAGNTAVETAEGSTKPETTETFVQVTDKVSTIPVFLNITRQAAEDHQQLMSYLRARMVYRVRRRLDSQLINGDGTGVNLLGLLNRSGILTYAPGSAEARVLSVRKAITLPEAYDLEADTVVLNPSDAEKFDLLTAAGSGEFMAGPGYVRQGETVWGLTRVVSNAITAGTALVLDRTSAMVWDRMDPTLYLTDSHASNFTANILTLLCELRAALSLFQPKGVVAVTFNGTT